MHWLNCFIQVSLFQIQCPVLNIGTEPSSLAPFFSAIAALSNLGLAIYVFGYTRKKNNTDTKIKWFLELVYSPNKDSFNAYFKSLAGLKEKFFAGDNPLTEQQKIDAMKFIKGEANKFRYEFVEVLKFIAPDMYKTINLSIEGLTDALVNAVDNDELKLENQKTYSREIVGPIMESKGKIIHAIFGYKG